MSVLQKEMGGKLGSSVRDTWKLFKALYGYAGSSQLWWDEVSGWLKEYGFRPLGISGTFMMLDRRNDDNESMQGIMLLNLYSDDGLSSIDNLTLFDKFMIDFNGAFDVVENDPESMVDWD